MKNNKYNYLAAAEMDEEGNYNMIDGIINNKPKTSVLERMKDYERQMAEHRKSDVIVNDEDEPELKRPSMEVI